MSRPKRSRPRSSRGLFALAIYMCAKGVVLLAVTFGVLHLLHKDVETVVTRWIEALRIDPDNHLIAGALSHLGMLETKELKQLSFLTGFYAALFLTQGVGLGLKQRWAEYLTLVATGFFIPIEIYELYHEVTVIKIGLLLINMAAFLYLLHLVRQKEARG